MFVTRTYVLHCHHIFSFVKNQASQSTHNSPIGFLSPLILPSRGAAAHPSCVGVMAGVRHGRPPLVSSQGHGRKSTIHTQPLGEQHNYPFIWRVTVPDMYGLEMKVSLKLKLYRKVWNNVALYFSPEDGNVNHGGRPDFLLLNQRRRRSTGNIVLYRCWTTSASILSCKNKPLKMSVVFVPKRQRGTAKINQETIQRVSEWTLKERLTTAS